MKLSLPLLARSGDENKQKPQPKTSRTHDWRDRISDEWLTETFFAFLSATCCISIYITLMVYDGGKVPTLRYGLTLNAIIAILATTSKSAISLVVAACISQRKWLWFQGNRRCLQDLQTYDDASRGPLGAVCLLFHRTFKSSTSLGAIIILLLLAYDPFIQQVLTYPVEQVFTESESARVSQALASPFIYPETTTFVFEQAVQTGIWSNQSVLQANCPSSNCTWSTFTALEWCSKCGYDPSWSLEIKNDCNLFSQNITLLTDLWMDLELGRGVNRTSTCTLTGVGTSYLSPEDASIIGDLFCIGRSADRTFCGSLASRLPHKKIAVAYELYRHLEKGDYGYETIAPYNIAILGYNMPLLAVNNIEFIYSNFSTQIGKFSTCVLDMCYRKYNISVQDGETNVEVLDEWPGQKHFVNRTLNDIGWTPGSEVEIPLLCWMPSSDIALDISSSGLEILHTDNSSEEAVYWINRDDNVFCLLLSADFGQRFRFDSIPTGTWHKQVMYNCSTTNLSSCVLQGDFPPFLPYEYEFNDTGIDFRRVCSKGLEETMDSVAMSLSQLTRTTSAGAQTIFGQAGTLIVRVRVRWPWLIPPFSLNIAGCLFLVLTVWGQRRERRLHGSHRHSHYSIMVSRERRQRLKF